MSTFNEPILTETVAAVAQLVTVCLLLLSRVCGKKAMREISLLNLLSSSMSHILEPKVVDLAVLARVAKAMVPADAAIGPARAASGIFHAPGLGVRSFIAGLTLFFCIPIRGVVVDRRIQLGAHQQNGR